MGLLLLGSFGLFPLSVLAGRAIVHAWGPAVLFPLAAGVPALAVLAGLTQRSRRELGASHPAAVDAVAA
jgi:hypothetical protein